MNTELFFFYYCCLQWPAEKEPTSDIDGDGVTSRMVIATTIIPLFPQQ